MCIFIKNCTFPPLVDAQRAHSAFRAYGVPYESKLRGVRFLLHIESPKEILSQSLPCSVL